MDKTVLRFFRVIARSEVEELILRRKAGEVIIKLNLNGSLVGDGPDTDADFLPLFRQIWHDHLVARGLFWDSEQQDSVGTLRSYLVPEVFADALLLCSELGLRAYPGNDIARKIVRMPEPTLLTVNGARLTTKHLLEGAASAQELHASIGALALFEDPSLVAEAIAKLEDSTYGMAYKLFESTVGFETEKYLDSLTTFSLMVDLALNPPLPPVVLSFPKPLSWHDIYPPLRFVTLCNAVKAIGLVEYGASSIEVEAWLDAIIDVTGLEDPRTWDTTHLNKALQTLDDSDTCGETHNGECWINWFLHAAHQAWEARRDFSELIPRLGECTHGEHCKKLCLYFAGDEGVDWFQAPFMLHAGEDIRHSYWSHYGSILMAALQFSDYLEEFLLHTGEPSLNSSPYDATVFITKHAFDATMAHIFDIPAENWRQIAFD